MGSDASMGFCSATSKQSGQPCKNRVKAGALVCAFHGGKAPQTQAKATERLQDMVHPALDQLRALLNSDDEKIVIAAIREVLNRSPDPTMEATLPSAAQVARWIADLEAEVNL